MEPSTPLLLREPPRSRALGCSARARGRSRSRTARDLSRCGPSPPPSRSVSSTCSPCCSSPCSGASGLGLLTALAQRAGLQLLPHSRRPAGSRSAPRELGRPRRPSSQRRRRQLARRARDAPRPGRRGQAQRGRPDGGAGPGPARRHRASTPPCPSPRSASPARSSCPRPRCNAARPPDQPGRLSLPLVSSTGVGWARWSSRPASTRDNLARLHERLVPGLEALLAAAIDREVTAQGHGRDRGASPERRDQDGAAADRLTRPPHADHGDPRRRRGAHLADHRGRRIAPTFERRSSTTRIGSRTWSTTCSICPGCARVRRSRPLTGPRSRRSSRRPSTTWHRSRPLPARDRRPPAIHQSRRRSARAGVRQPALQCRQVLGRRAGLGTRSRGVRAGW